MNWNNIDLQSPYETSRNVLDSITSDDLLLCFDHNVRDLNSLSITQEFEANLERAVESARDVFKANLLNYLREAKARREGNEAVS